MSVDTSVELGGVALRNPVLTASGTFGYGTEFAAFLDAISLRPHFRRFAEGLVFASDITFFIAMAAISFVVCRLAFDLRRVGG